MFRRREIDNEMYKTRGDRWWNEDESAATLRYFINPIRFAYFQRILAGRPVTERDRLTVLDVGCGGGFLSEEFARAGFAVTGVDPAGESVECARRHAAESGLRIDYRQGSGEAIPFADATFEIVLCCDVLEHVDAIEPVLREIARVLKPGGLFFYDTINRTFSSYVGAIKILQDWPWTAQHEPRGHVWWKFIKPRELHEAMARAGLAHVEDRGIAPTAAVPVILANLRRRVKGKISFRDLGERIAFRESDNMSASYMGYAVKEGRVREGGKA